MLSLQPKFKQELEDGIKKFEGESQEYLNDYNMKGPMEPGITPREASDRLAIFNTQFNELWRKHDLYAGGQELFGLKVSEHKDLNNIKKELNLLQKLYGLFDDVNSTFDKYYEVAWQETKIEAINESLTDFQTRVRKLPKGMVFIFLKINHQA